MARQGKIPYHLGHFLSWLRRDQRSKDTLVGQWRLSSRWTQSTRLRGHPFLTVRPFPVCACIPPKSSHPLPVTLVSQLGQKCAVEMHIALIKVEHPSFSPVSLTFFSSSQHKIHLLSSTQSSFLARLRFSIYSFFQTTFLPVFPLRRKRKKLNV